MRRIIDGIRAGKITARHQVANTADGGPRRSARCKGIAVQENIGDCRRGLLRRGDGNNLVKGAREHRTLQLRAALHRRHIERHILPAGQGRCRLN